jgi:uncharacterized protein (DUF983 family)
MQWDEYFLHHVGYTAAVAALLEGYCPRCRNTLKPFDALPYERAPACCSHCGVHMRMLRYSDEFEVIPRHTTAGKYTNVRLCPVT